MRHNNTQLRGSDHVLVGFNPVSTAFKLAIVLGGIFLLVKLSLGWSLKETEELSEFLIGKEYAILLAWMVQLAPQILLMLRVVVQDKTGRVILIVAAIIFNLIDAGTNIIAFSAVSRVAPADWPLWAYDAALVIGYMIVFAITWAEEALALLIGLAMHMIVMLLGALNMPQPAFLTVGASYATAAGGGRI